MGRYSGKKCRLLSMFGLTASFFMVELVVGHVTNSMALIADSFHMLSDIAALIIAFISVRMAPKSWDKNTYGWARAEVLGALVNAVFLVALCFSITMESLKRFLEPEDIHDPKLILLVGVMGLIVNLLGLCLFHEHGGGSHGLSHGGTSTVDDHGTHSHLAALADDNDKDCNNEDASKQERSSVKVDGSAKSDKHVNNHGHSHANMNMRGVFLHVMADALGSVVVITSALVMWLTDWKYKQFVDPGLSLVMVCLMLRSVWPLLIQSALILLQTVPTHIEVDTLKRKLLENIDGILAVHDFHIWQLAGDRIIASAHIRCLNLSEYMKTAENIKEFFHNEGIHSTTIQPEFVDINNFGLHVRGSSTATEGGFRTAIGSKGELLGRCSSVPLVNEDDCVLSCPKGPAEQAPNCQKSKCCLPPKDGDNKDGPMDTGLSAQNTPCYSRKSERPGSFVVAPSEDEDSSNPSWLGYNFSTANNVPQRSSGRQDSKHHFSPTQPSKVPLKTQSYSSRFPQISSSTPKSFYNRSGGLRHQKSSPGFANFSTPGTVITNMDTSTMSSGVMVSSPIKDCGDTTVDLSNDSIPLNGNSNDEHDENLGVIPLQDYLEDSPMVLAPPRSSSRVVRIVSKQSNV